MTLARRSLLKALGMVPAAAVSAQSQIGAMMASPAVTAALAATTQLSSGGFPLNASHSIFGELLSNQLNLWRDLAEREGYDRRAARIRGLDADIAVLKSTSQTFRARKQLERDASEQEMLARVQRVLWGTKV